MTSLSSDPKGLEPEDSVWGGKFKSSTNQWLLKPIFFETSDSDKSKVLYTLKPEDHTFKGVTYPSLRRLYLESDDETEYLFAEQHLGGWTHWKRLSECTWFSPYLAELREELAVRSAARRLHHIRLKAASGDISANKYLLEGKWKSDNPVGRPTKEAIKREANRLFQNDFDLQDDLTRIQMELSA